MVLRGQTSQNERHEISLQTSPKGRRCIPTELNSKSLTMNTTAPLKISLLTREEGKRTSTHPLSSAPTTPPLATVSSNPLSFAYAT